MKSPQSSQISIAQSIIIL